MGMQRARPMMMRRIRYAGWSGRNSQASANMRNGPTTQFWTRDTPIRRRFAARRGRSPYRTRARGGDIIQISPTESGIDTPPPEMASSPAGSPGTTAPRPTPRPMARKIHSVVRRSQMESRSSVIPHTPPATPWRSCQRGPPIKLSRRSLGTARLANGLLRGGLREFPVSARYDERQGHNRRPELPSVALDDSPCPRDIVGAAGGAPRNDGPHGRRVRRARDVPDLPTVDDDGILADGNDVRVEPESDEEPVHVPLVRRPGNRLLTLVAPFREADCGLHASLERDRALVHVNPGPRAPRLKPERVPRLPPDRPRPRRRPPPPHLVEYVRPRKDLEPRDPEVTGRGEDHRALLIDRDRRESGRALRERGVADEPAHERGCERAVKRDVGRRELPEDHIGAAGVLA